MTQPAARATPILRLSSRFRLRVTLTDQGIKPYSWEIYDEHEDRVARRSKRRFRTPGEAWKAGSVITDK
jgi:hypothetical protein